MEEESKSLKDYLHVARRRKYVIAIPAILLMVLSVFVVMILPPVYQSTATILVEQQHIPTDLVKSTVSSFADERIKVIEQKTMTFDKLSSIISKYDLYQDKGSKQGNSALVELFRQNVGVQLMSANVTGGVKATIAFKILFSDKDAKTAQMVVNELVGIFLNENVKARTQRAEETTKFLEDESEKFRIEVQKTEDSIAEYKEKYKDSLPELLQSNLATISRLESNLQQLELQEKMIHERRLALNSQLTFVPPTLESSNAGLLASKLGGTTKPTANTLNEVKSLENVLLSKYSESHPDVQRLRRQIELLKKQEENEDESDELTKANEQLAELKKKYSENHPDVKSLLRHIDTLKQTESEKDSTNETEQHQTKSNKSNTNPAYVQIKTEMEIAEIELQNIKEQRGEIQKKLNELEANVTKTHQVERGYYDLMRDLENNKTKYQELKAKQLQAKLAQTLEEEQKAERFALIEPPQVADKPVKPDRFKLLVMGIAASLGGGVGFGFLAELLDGSIRSAKTLKQVSGLEPLVVIPYIRDQLDEKRTRTNIIRFSMMLVFLLIGLIVAMHFLYMPLDVIWYKAWNRLGLL